MPSICFVNSDNYPVLDPEFGSRYIGGESVQQTLLAKEFARRGWQVSMVCEDFGQPNGVTIDGIQVWKTFSADEGLPILRFFYPRLTRIWNALGKANADVYFQSCAGAMTGFVARYCAATGRHMIFRIAHDTDCIPGKQLIRFWRDRKIYEYGIAKADFVSAQSEHQKALLQKNYGLPSDVIDMAVETPVAADERARDIDVLWVNNLRDFKRPDLLCEIARAMPGISFVMIGGAVPGHEDIHAQTVASAKQIQNLNYVGAVPYKDVNRYFERSKIFINTSDSEGFPNSFLQAWIREVPVISFFDPDSVIARHGLGASPDTVQQMQDTISRLLADERERWSIGERARKYVITRYSPSAVVDEYEKRLRALFDFGAQKRKRSRT